VADEIDPVPESPLQEWEEFRSRHPGHRMLQFDPLYSLPVALIDAINKGKAFFSADDEKFERDLAASAGFGFFKGLRYGHAAKDDELVDRSPGRRQRSTADEIDEIINSLLRQSGLREGEIREYAESERTFRMRIDERQCSYVGWLVTNPDFQHDLKMLRQKWESSTPDVLRMPRLKVQWLVRDDGETGPAEFRNDCRDFYLKWGLETLVNWDWPFAMEPDFGSRIRESASEFANAGLVVVIPWYLLRGGKVDMNVLVNQRRFADTPERLRPYVVSQGGGRQGDIGDQRFQRMRFLYRWLELTLKRRYANECNRQLRRLDEAFAAVLKCDGESVRKLRLDMQRRVNGGSKPSANDH